MVTTREKPREDTFMTVEFVCGDEPPFELHFTKKEWELLKKSKKDMKIHRWATFFTTVIESSLRDRAGE